MDYIVKAQNFTLYCNSNGLILQLFNVLHSAAVLVTKYIHSTSAAAG